MHDKLIIIGASGHGKVLADIACKMDNWKEIMFLDDNQFLKEVLGFKVLGKVEEASKYKDTADFIVGIGDNYIRERIQEKLSNNGFSVTTLVHPDAIIGIDVKIGVGTVVMAGTVINSSTIIGNGSIINTSSSIDHDNVLAEYVHVSPGVGIGGTVIIGKNTWVGIGSTIINNVHVTKNTVIGAGSIVLKDIVHPGTYAGTPVRRKVNG